MNNETDHTADPAQPEPQKRLQIISGAISFCIGALIVGAIFFGAASCSQKSKYADWDEKCENAFAHERDINDCKALGRNNAVLVAK